MSWRKDGSISPAVPQDIKPPVSPSTRGPHSRTTINQELHMARIVFVVNDALREKVRHLAGLGVPQDDIAKIIGCTAKTLRKRFRDELDRGVAEANATISGFLFAAAKAGNITAMIFWLTTRAHRRVTNDVAIAKNHDFGATRTADRVSPNRGRHLRIRWCGGRWQDRRTDPGAAAPCRPGAGLYRGILPPHHTADHQSRRVMGREPKLLSAAWRHPAPARARMALATWRQDQVLASPA